MRERERLGLPSLCVVRSSIYDCNDCISLDHFIKFQNPSTYVVDTLNDDDDDDDDDDDVDNDALCILKRTNLT